MIWLNNIKKPCKKKVRRIKKFNVSEINFYKFLYNLSKILNIIYIYLLLYYKYLKYY